MDGLKNIVHGLNKSLNQFAGADLHGFRQAVCQIPALDLLIAHVGPLNHAADAALQFFRGAQADEHIVLLPDELDDGFIKAGTGHLERLTLHHAAGRDDGDIGSAAADIDDHMPVSLGDIHAGAQGGGHSSLQQVDLSGAGLNSGVNDGPLLHAGDAAGDAGQDAGLEQAERGDAVHQFPQHLGGDLIVRDDAGVDGMDGHDVGRGTAKHSLGLLADLQYSAAELVHGYHSRLPGDHALPLLEQQGGGCTHINGNISFKQIHVLLLYL